MEHSLLKEEQRRADAAEYRTAMLLWLAFGFFGAHRFYMGEFFWGFLMLIITVLAIVLLFIWGLVLNSSTGGAIAVLVVALGLLVIAGIIWIVDFINMQARVQAWQERRRDVEYGLTQSNKQTPKVKSFNPKTKPHKKKHLSVPIPYLENNSNTSSSSGVGVAPSYSNGSGSGMPYNTSFSSSPSSMSHSEASVGGAVSQQKSKARIAPITKLNYA